METEEKNKPKYIKPYMYMEELLCEAASSGNLISAARILHERIDPNCKDHVGRSPLHYAAMNGHFDMIRLLLCNRAVVDAVDFNNVTPLHLAARNNSLRCTQLLCMAGADYTLKCASGCTARDLAPYDSATCHFLEKYETGERPRPKAILSRLSKPVIPPYAIPQTVTTDAKNNKKMLKNKKK
ncbi:unnamed protein product [Trichobilharzia szidati]|nr:unnamed protein product [Trichobilharzia szidati]